jgi:hypothetical protein
MPTWLRFNTAMSKHAITAVATFAAATAFAVAVRAADETPSVRPTPEIHPGSHAYLHGTKGMPTGATNCADLSEIPRRYDVTYDEVAQAWAQGGCTGCHNQDAAQNGGSLRLDGRIFGIVGLLYQPSYRNPDLIRVSPGDPKRSLAYWMINCEPPPTYTTMPISGLTFPNVRALVYDWIAAGAPAFDDGAAFSDVVFISGLESERF